MHIAVDTLGTPACLAGDARQRTGTRRVGELSRQVQEATQRSVDPAWVDQDFTDVKNVATVAARSIELEVVKLAEAKRGFMMLPRLWVVERSFA